MRATSKYAPFLVVGLIVLSLVPVVGGMARLIDLGGGQITTDNARFIAAPLPVVLHIVTASVYCVLGAFQFAPQRRHHRPSWHRAAGGILVPCGLGVALTGLWMTQFYPAAGNDGAGVYAMRIAVGLAMTLFICRGALAIRSRDFIDHRAWMIRAYAIGLSAGTQVLTHLPWLVFPAMQGQFSRSLSMGAGWAINMLLAEWIIRRQQPPQMLPAQPLINATSRSNSNTSKD